MWKQIISAELHLQHHSAETIIPIASCILGADMDAKACNDTIISTRTSLQKMSKSFGLTWSEGLTLCDMIENLSRRLGIKVDFCPGDTDRPKASALREIFRVMDRSGKLRTDLRKVIAICAVSDHVTSIAEIIRIAQEEIGW